MKKMEQNTEKRRERKAYRGICCAAVWSACLLAGCAGGNPQTNESSAIPSVQEPQTQEETMQEASVQPQQTPENAASEPTAQEPQKQEQPVQEQPQQQQPAQEQPQQQSSAGSAQGVGTQADIGLEQAKSTALAQAGLKASDVTFIKEEQDYDDGRLEYEIEFVTAGTKYEYEISADDGSILKSSQEPIEQNAGAAQMQNGITQEEAKKIALDYAGLNEELAAFSKVEFDYDDGIAEYEIEFYADKKEYSFSINAATGEILEMEIDMD